MELVGVPLVCITLIFIYFSCSLFFYLILSITVFFSHSFAVFITQRQSGVGVAAIWGQGNSRPGNTGTLHTLLSQCAHFAVFITSAVFFHLVRPP